MNINENGLQTLIMRQTSIKETFLKIKFRIIMLKVRDAGSKLLLRKVSPKISKVKPSKGLVKEDF